MVCYALFCPLQAQTYMWYAYIHTHSLPYTCEHLIKDLQYGKSVRTLYGFCGTEQGDGSICGRSAPLPGVQEQELVSEWKLDKGHSVKVIHKYKKNTLMEHESTLEYLNE